MDYTEDPQQLEITALKSIYAEDFIECPPPKAWKGAARLPEFIIRVAHPYLEHASKIYFDLNVKFPKTYPRLASPTFAVQRPASGLNNDQLTKLSHEINVEAQKYKGSEMVFQIVTFCQEWIANNVVPPVEVPGSLALQMIQRAIDEERMRKQREAEEAEKEQERADRAAHELDEQIQADALRQLIAREQQYKARKRAGSEATEVPTSSDTPTETFSKEIDINGVQFNSVKLFHPRSDSLGTVYMAEPVSDDIHTTLPLELFVVTFDSHYYTTTQGRKKLKQVEGEIQRLTLIRHQNLISVFAVKLNLPHSSGPPQLMVLSEQGPALTLHDVLEDCESLREDRASDYLAQLLAALSAIHISDIVHRGVSARCIGLSSRDSTTQSKTIKLGRVGYHIRLLDLHRSNPFGNIPQSASEESQIPEGWLSRDVKNESSLLYTRHRDIHSVGIVLLQMLLGLDVTEKFTDVHDALQSSSISPVLARLAINMILPSKKNVSCLTLLADLADASHGRPASNNRSPSILFTDPKTPIPIHFGSPESDYFRMPQGARQASRWKEDWDELELLGKGAFGSVVKARNKIDNRIYAVKKVRLKTMQSDTKIFREVNALSRLSHRFIVRYYTTWVEIADTTSSAASDDSGTESGTEEGMTSVPGLTSERHLPTNGGFEFKLDDFDDATDSRSSFPSIHFERSSSPGTSGEDSSGESDFRDLFKSNAGIQKTLPPILSRTLYIQMEFVERQTLKERVDEGISEDEAWRLFQQILDALVHMSTLGILHRDIKLTNIFIDGKGDCKVGDFGLATSSLAAVDPSDVSPRVVAPDADMTLEVGTRLYIAPEVQSRKRGPRNHSKADMYSLGIVFFEMNYKFSTASERIAVLEDIRKQGIFFPTSWEPRRSRQREIINWLLQHEPDDRPTALELSQSALLPPRLEDEYFNGALRMMAKPDSPHHQAVLSSLFNQPPRPSRGFLYDLEAEPPEHATLNDTVQDRLASIFRLHGAVDMEPLLLMPVMDPDSEKNQATFIDRNGDIVALPNNILVPFARLAARGNVRRIKRYHITNIFRPNAVAGHPKVQKAAVFDIVTQDLESGPTASCAEIISVANDCLNSFPNLAQNYDIHISHSKIVELALSRIPTGLRNSVAEVLNQAKSTPAAKRSALLKKGILRSNVDELEILSETELCLDEDSDILARLEKASPTLVAFLEPAIDELRSALRHARAAGITRPIYFHPLMLGNHHDHFKNGVIVEVVRASRRMDVLAAGGRYDTLISQFAPPKQKGDSVCAFGLQIAVEKITVALAAYQSASVKTLVKEEGSFGFWSPRRCDVYVVSYHPGHLMDRLDLVSYLWRHNISADLMYESGLTLSEQEHRELCLREGILFTVCPRPRGGRSAFKIKSMLRSIEDVELSKQELVGWLQHQISEQKRIDLSTSGVPNFPDSVPGAALNKDIPVPSDVQVLLPVDVKKQRKQVKHMFIDRAFESGVQLKASVQSGLPILAVDVAPTVFDAMTRTSAWINDDEAWKTIESMFLAQHSAYAQQIREAASKRKVEGHRFILLFAVREERVQLVTLS